VGSNPTPSASTSSGVHGDRRALSRAEELQPTSLDARRRSWSACLPGCPHAAVGFTSEERSRRHASTDTALITVDSTIERYCRPPDPTRLRRHQRLPSGSTGRSRAVLRRRRALQSLSSDPLLDEIERVSVGDKSPSRKRGVAWRSAVLASASTNVTERSHGA
jgi:hypothetical protein